MEKIFYNIVSYAIDNQCSDIHIETSKTNLYLMFRKAGRISKTQVSLNKASKLIHYICFLANLDLINAHNLDTGMILYSYKKRDFNLRVSFISCYENKSLVIRVIDNHQDVSINNLCFLQDNTNTLKDILSLNNGLVLFTGKTGSGKTTTLYTLVEEFLKQNKKIISIEKPIEKKIDNITQIDLSNQKISHQKAFEQVLRHDPDVIIYGEIRSSQELSYVVNAALSGHLVLSTMHALSSEYVINKLKALNIDKDDLKAIIRYIIYQKIYVTKDNKTRIIFEKINQEDVSKLLNNDSIEIKTINDITKKYIEAGLIYEGK